MSVWGPARPWCSGCSDDLAWNHAQKSEYLPPNNWACPAAGDRESRTWKCGPAVDSRWRVPNSYARSELVREGTKPHVGMPDITVHLMLPARGVFHGCLSAY